MRRLMPVLVSLGMAALMALAGVARAADTAREVRVTIEGNRFTPEEITVKAGAPFVLVITNKDRGPEEFESRDLKIEKVIPGGKTVQLKVPSLKPGTYGFVGEYHEKTAKGRIVAE